MQWLLKFCGPIVCAVACAAVPVDAATIGSVTYEPFTEFAVNKVSPIATGAHLAGAKVEVERASSVVEVATFAATGTLSGIAAGGGWELKMDGFTSSDEWVLRQVGSGLSADPICRLTIILADPFNPPMRHSVFDVADPTPGSAGSEIGQTFDFHPSGATSGVFTIDVQYSDPVSLGGATPVGDLFGRLDLFFGVEQGAKFGASQEDLLAFTADTDVAGVPEPTTLMLLAAVGASLGLLSPRRGRRV